MAGENRQDDGKLVKLDVDSKGCAFGEFLRTRIWINVHEPLRRCVVLESAKDGSKAVFCNQYEDRPYFCFSSGVSGIQTCFVQHQLNVMSMGSCLTVKS
jgi:Fe-S-cluster containining protein